jgi:hydrogenase/urease accessory protein HupE
VTGGPLVVLTLTLIAEPALAHPPPLGVPGFFGGLLHPFFVPPHVLAMAGLGLLIGIQMPRWSRAAALAYVAALAAGLGLMTLGIVPRWMGEGLLVSAVVTGGLVALARPLPEILGIALAILTAVAIALDSPPQVISIREANLMLIGTGFGATMFLVALAETAARIKRPWWRLGARVLGSWIAAGATLSLALQLAR